MQTIKTISAIFIIFTLLLSGCSPSTFPQIQTLRASITTTNTSFTSSPTTSSIDNDKDSIYDSIEENLIKQFAPVVYLNSEEEYLPSNIVWYLPRVRMRFDVDFGIDDKILNIGEVNLTTLINKTDRNQSSGLSKQPTHFFLEHTDKWGNDLLDDYRMETRASADQTQWVCYSHVRPVPAGSVGKYDIQYIFFYAYNGDLVTGPVVTEHEADFEHITVRP